jgi:hypothetical protein
MADNEIIAAQIASALIKNGDKGADNALTAVQKYRDVLKLLDDADAAAKAAGVEDWLGAMKYENQR